MNIILRSPSLEDKKKVLKYKEDFMRSNEALAGDARLRNADTYEKWLSNVVKNSKKETVEEGLSPSTTLLAIHKNSEGEEKLVGMIDIRHTLSEFLLNYGGHIGYSVAIDSRRKGIATEMLRQGLEVCKELGIDKVLVMFP